MEPNCETNGHLFMSAHRCIVCGTPEPPEPKPMNSTADKYLCQLLAAENRIAELEAALTKVKALWHEAAGKCRLQEIRIRAYEIALRRIADHLGELDSVDCARIAFQALSIGSPLSDGAEPK